MSREVHNQERAQDKYYGGMAAMDAGDFPAAVRLLRESLLLGPHGKTAWQLAQCAIRLGMLEVSLVYLEMAYCLSPTSDQIAVDLACSLGSEGRLVEARALITAVLARNPTYGPALRLEQDWR